jgi:hypothetical protein
MDNIIHLPSLQPIGLSSDEDRRQTSGPWGVIPKGLIEWISGTEKLDREHHGFVVAEISCVEAYWSFVELGFLSAGFMVKTLDGRRFHLQCAIDENNQPDMVAVSSEELPAGQMLPEFGNDIEPFGGWSNEVDAFNIDLVRLKASNAA